MGVAFLDHEKLMYHGVKVIGRGQCPNDNLRHARNAVLRLVADFQPDTLALEKAFFGNNRNVALLNVLVDEIRSIAHKKHLILMEYAPCTIKKFTCGNGRADKADVARVVVSRFPELKVYLTQDRAWKVRFHQNMFDAVALAMMALARAETD